MQKETNKLWDKGEKLYDDFIETLFKIKRANVKRSNPRTDTLELFSLLNEKRDKTLLIGAMCRELAEDIGDTPFAENGELFENITIKRIY